MSSVAPSGVDPEEQPRPAEQVLVRAISAENALDKVPKTDTLENKLSKAMSKFRKALKGVIGGSTIKPKPFTIILVVSSSIALSVLGEGVILSPAAARPVDGGFYSWYGMDDYFLVENGKYVPAYFRGAKRKLSEFDEISPWILMDKSSGTFYCSSSLRTNSGKAPSDSSGEQHICSKSGWKNK